MVFILNPVYGERRFEFVAGLRIGMEVGPVSARANRRPLAIVGLFPFPHLPTIGRRARSKKSI